MPQDALEACCNQRHACFQTCGASRKACEKAFKQCTTRTCAALPSGEESKACASAANLHHMMSGLQDCRDFAAAQSAGCKCLAPDKAVTQRQKLLNDLYAKVSAARGKRGREQGTCARGEEALARDTTHLTAADSYCPAVLLLTAAPAAACWLLLTADCCRCCWLLLPGCCCVRRPTRRNSTRCPDS